MIKVIIFYLAIVGCHVLLVILKVSFNQMALILFKFASLCCMYQSVDKCIYICRFFLNTLKHIGTTCHVNLKSTG